MTPILLAASLTLPAFAQEKIVNGTEAEPNQFPETVMVAGGGTCTGSLIHPNWVLTAAHCFDSTDFSVSGPGGGTTILIGNGGTQGFERQIDAELVVVHPRYVALEPSLVAWSEIGEVAPDEVRYDLMTNDIALVKLTQPYNGTLMSLNTEPIDATWLAGDVRVTHIGFGITAFGGSDSGTKRYADVPMVGYSDAPPTGNWGVSFFDADAGRSTCQGDSGGPGVVRVGQDAYFQIGVTSYGIECGTGIGTKMRVDPYIDWILGREDGAMDDGVVDEDEWIREEAERVPFVQTGAAGPPRFECSHQLNPESDNSFAIGVVPFELHCTATLPDIETLEQITWYWGDGTAPDTRAATPEEQRVDPFEYGEHTYTEMGVYNLRACFEGTRGEAPYNQCVTKSNHVNACDIPVAQFEVTPLEDLTLGLRNLTSLNAHNCITNAQWDIYAGASASGEPLLSVPGWEPVPQLDEPGDYTVVLHVGGLAGTSAAQATVSLKRRSSGGCDAVGMAPAAGLLALLPLLAVRRRD